MLNAFGALSGAALAVGLLFYYVALEVGQLLSFALLGERPTLTQVAGIVLIVIGVVMLLGPAPAQTSPSQSSGHSGFR